MQIQHTHFKAVNHSLSFVYLLCHVSDPYPGLHTLPTYGHLGPHHKAALPKQNLPSPPPQDINISETWLLHQWSLTSNRPLTKKKRLEKLDPKGCPPLGRKSHPSYILAVCVLLFVHIRGRTYAKKLRFLCKKRAGYTNLKMPCVYCTQKTVTSNIKMRLVFLFFAPTREGL